MYWLFRACQLRALIDEESDATPVEDRALGVSHWLHSRGIGGACASTNTSQCQMKVQLECKWNSAPKSADDGYGLRIRALNVPYT